MISSGKTSYRSKFRWPVEGVWLKAVMTVDWYFADWVLTPEEPPLYKAEVGIDKDSGKIVAFRQSVNDQGAADDQDGITVLTPGLINAHTHLELYSDQPIPVLPGESMADWLLKTYEWVRSLTPSDKRQACQRSVTEMIRTGSTCINDITSEGMSLDILSQVGMRGIVSPEFFYPFHHEEPTVEAIIERFWNLKNRFATHPLLTLGISPHSPFNVTPQACRKVLDGAEAVALVHTHMAESGDEMEWFQKGASPLDRLHETILGQSFGPIQGAISPINAFEEMLSENWLIAHGVHCSEAEYAFLAERGASLCHCPRSNLWLTGKTLNDYKTLIKNGLVVGLGTDSRLSNHDLDLREEGRIAGKHHGLSASDVFELMTLGSAQAIKQSHQIGRLVPGYCADMVLWQSSVRDDNDPYALWLSPETQAAMVWINGRIVLERVLS
jgi:cytosine/adenosine deaminase-related metal-dependent hydrolase